MQHIDIQGDAGSFTNQAGASRPSELGIRFVGSGSEYFRIWVVNLLLTLVTLGLYYPFAKTRRLKYFYDATEVGGHRLSFHGRPWAMFRGYFIAGLLFILYTVAEDVSPVIGIVAFALLMLAWPALWHASLRFRLANTGWRGLRLRFTGTRGGAYHAFSLMFAGLLLFIIGVTLVSVSMESSQILLGHALVMFLLTYLVAFLLSPAGYWLYRRYQQSNLAVANEQTKFDVGVGKFYRLFVVALLYSVLVALGAGFVTVALDESISLSSTWQFTAIGIAGYLAVLCVVGGYFTARLQNLVWNGTRSPGLAFRSTLSAIALIKLWFKNWVLTLLTVGLYHPYAKVASARLRLEAVTLLATANVDELVAAPDANTTTATGDAAGDLFGLDLGL